MDYDTNLSFHPGTQSENSGPDLNPTPDKMVNQKNADEDPNPMPLKEMIVC